MRRSVAPLVLLACGLVACAQLPQSQTQMLSANYAEVQRLVEADIREAGVVNTSKLAPLCTAYSALKLYDKLFDCCDRLEAQIRKGDTSPLDLDALAKTSWVWAKVRDMYAKSPVRPGEETGTLPAMLRAQAHIELGQYARAIEEARKAYIMKPLGVKQMNYQVRVLGIIGLAYALNGDTERARQTAERLERVSTAHPYTMSRIDKNVGLARIYLALREFPRALEAIQREHTSTSIRILMALNCLELTFQELPKDFMLNKCLFEAGRTA
jgi:tetratricopeptide (TPR) repeat protein